MNNIIAITGGIGSGKSTLCDLFKKKGYTVLSADEIYNELLENQFFAKGIYDALGLEFKGEYDRKEVSEVVFNDKSKLEILNNMTHRLVYEEMLSRSDEKTVHEIPLLFESGFDTLYNNIVVIKRNLNDRIKAVCERSNLTEDEVKLRINNQYNYENIPSKCYILENNGSIEDLDNQLNRYLGYLNNGKTIYIERPTCIENKEVNKVKDVCFVLGAISIILDALAGLGLVLGFVSFVVSMTRKENSVTLKWARALSLLGFFLGLLVIVCITLVFITNVSTFEALLDYIKEMYGINI